jgi:OOP family OmpA-OmpF porin
LKKAKSNISLTSLFARAWTLVLAVVSFALCSNSQNLVVNGSFEENTYCPTNFNQQSLNNIRSWRQATEGTPDYFHSCSKAAGVPENIFGEQAANDGEGYAGLVTFTPSKRNYREYLQAELSRPLSSGEMVCIEFYICPAEKAWFVTDGIGAHFASDRVQGKNQQTLPFLGQVENPRLNVVDNVNSWTKISDTYIAGGGEKYVTIGNFRTDRELNILQRTVQDGAEYSNDWAYLYIDNVSVVSVSSEEDCSCVNDIVQATVHDPPLQLADVREVEFTSILFDFDESFLTGQAREELSRILNLLRRNDEFYLRIIGYTDVVGSDDYNLGLSEKRAAAVIKYLVDKGASKDRLEMVWKGSANPIADNTTNTGRAQNRRVEFQMLQPEFTRYQ